MSPTIAQDYTFQDESLVSRSDSNEVMMASPSAKLPRLNTPLASPSSIRSLSSSLSISSSAVSPNRSRHFDDRLRSRIASSPKLLRNKLLSTSTLTFPESSRSRNLSVSNGIYRDRPDAINWVKMKRVSSEIGSREFKIQYGDATSMTSTDVNIAFGTWKGYVIIFDYDQRLVYELGKDAMTSNLGPVTALSFSLDSTYIAVGYSSGEILVWDLPQKQRQVLYVRPISQDEFHGVNSIPKEGHLIGTPIVQIRFIGKRHTALMSSDENGFLVCHEGGRSVMGYYVKSKILFGNKEGIPSLDHNSILSFNSLPIGSLPQLTDELGVLAVISTTALIVISTQPSLQTHFKVGKPKILKESFGLTGLVSWFPATRNRAEKTFNVPMLAYTWSNILTLFEVNSETIIDKNGVKSVMMRFENKKRWICSECVVALHWLNSKIIVVLTKTHRLIFLSRDPLKVLCSVDLMSRHIKYTEFYKGNKFRLVTQNYYGALTSFKSRIFILGKTDFVTGALTNWADVLSELLRSGNYVEALEQGKNQYMGNCDIALLGLPADDKVRHQLVYNDVVKILDASLNFIFADKNILQASIEERTMMLENFLNTTFSVCITINSSPEIYETVFEKFEGNELTELYFKVLEPLILKDQLTVLSPFVLKGMVKYYIDKDKGEILEELLCLLDIKQLDIDLTIQLCQRNHLNDTLVYIWNTLMCDYISPLFDAVKEIQKLTYFPTDFNDHELSRIAKDAVYVYPYISYILTGRQYPTDTAIDSNKIEPAKLNLYYTLFNGAAISWPKDSEKLHIREDVSNEPAFPYLYLLLKYDSFQMFACLNEAFEDELLNDDEILAFSNTSSQNYELKVNRQYIIDVLIGIFNENDDFSPSDKTYLAIFVSRNYPKYQQFIRLSDFVLTEIVQTLCSYPEEELKDECELSLQGLLQVYKPTESDSLISMLESAGFYNALLGIYKSENKMLQLLELWIKSKEDIEKYQQPSSNASFINLDENPFADASHTIEYNEANALDGSTNYGAYGINEMFESVPVMVEKCLINSEGSAFERMQVEEFISSKFEVFIKDYPAEMATVFSKYYPKLNDDIIGISDTFYKYTYLNSLIDLSSKSALNFAVSEELKLEYVKLLSKFDPTKLKDYILTIGSIDFDIMEYLEENNEIEIIVDVYKRNGHYEKAIHKIIVIINNTGQQIISEGYNKFLVDKLWQYLFLGFELLETSDKDNKHIKENGLTENESLLLELVESTVSLFVKANQSIAKHRSQTDQESKVLGVFKRYIQDSFTNLIDLKQDASESFLRIFYEFLSRSSVKITKLGDVRTVLNEIYLAYSHGKTISNIILKLVNEDIYADLEKLEELKLKGWSLHGLECEVCGKNIWGSRINSNSFETWQDNKLGIEIQQDVKHSLEIIVFQCKHGYHTKCLDGMGMQKTDRCCILCNPK